MQEKILVIDHRRPMREALRLYLARYPEEWEIVAELDRIDSAAIIDCLDAYAIGIVILSRTTAGGSLQGLISALKAHRPELCIIVVGVKEEEIALIGGWGADNTQLSTDPPSTLLTRLRTLRCDREK